MKKINFIFSIVGAAAAWSTPGFAQRQQAIGPGQIPLSVAGGLSGVDMSASGTTGTLVVGVVGGPATNILSSNNPFVAGPVAVSTAASSQGNIVFNSGSTVYGNIGVTQPGGPFLLNISGGNTGTAVNFLSAVSATTLNVTGTGAVNFDSGSINTTATNFAADGTIALAPNTTVIGALTTTAGADTGTLNLGSASVLNGAVGGAVGLRAIGVTGGSNLAGVSATITGAVDAYSFSLGTNTLNIGGALTVANGGTGGVINTTLASSSVYGNIRPVGATNLGPTLLVNVTVPQTTVLATGSQFNIIQTQAGTLQSGTNGSVVTVSVKDPTNPLYTFTAIPAAGTIAGLVTIQTAGTPLTTPLAPPVNTPLPVTQPIVVPVIPVLVALIPAAAPASDILTVIAPINALTDPAAVTAAVAQLAPSGDSLAAPQVTFQATKQFQDLVLERLTTALCTPTTRTDNDTAVCRGDVQPANWWIKGFGYWGDQGARQAFTGYDANTYGTMIGYDMPIGPDTRVGVGIGYAGSAINDKSLGNHTDVDSFQATAYAGHKSGPWYVNGDLSFGWNDYSGARNIAFPGVNRTALSSYNGQDYTAFATTGFNIPAMGFTITPLASLQYTNVSIGGFSETGAGAVNLAVQSQSYNFLESGLGAKVSHDFIYEGMGILPEVHAKWLHELTNPTPSQTASFAVPGSASFSTTGLKTADDTYNIGAGITLLSCSCHTNSWSVEAVYDYYVRNDHYSAQQAMIKLSMRF